MPSQFDTAEFRRSDGPRQHNAAVAWQQGFAGDGVTIAVIDTGVDEDSPEFAGRISPASRDIYPDDRPLTGPDDHGTNVSLVAAADNNNEGILGIAWESTLLAIRADQPGSCMSDSPTDPSIQCSFVDAAIADAVDYAVVNGARVINISLGGSGASAQLRNSVGAAVDAGLLVVLAAGNGGTAQPSGFARELEASGNGGVLIVGSVDQSYEISDFSNRAGGSRNAFITARGETVCCVYEDGEIFVDNDGFVYLYSGTSFAAPQVAGAAALLAQAFPALTGREIAEILLETAFDVGAPGADGVYGQGILDIAAAFQPLGTTSLAGSSTPLSLSDGMGTASAAMGDALSTASLSAIVTDRYNRAFAADLADFRGAQVPERLHAALGRPSRNVSVQAGPASVAFSIDASGRAPPRAGHLSLTPDEAESARVLAARVAMKLDADTDFGFAYHEGAGGLVAQMQGQERPAFMVAGDARGDAGLFMRSGASFALRRQVGDWGLTFSAEGGEIVSGSFLRRAASLRGQRLEERARVFGMALDRDFGPLEATFGLSLLQEDRTLLGAHFHESLGLTGADTVFLDSSAGLDLGGDWRLGASYRRGWSRAHEGGHVASASLASEAWSFDIARSDNFVRGDRLAVRLSQPLRVENGGIDLSLPVSYDYATGTPTYAAQTLLLSPEGREMVGEIAWTGHLFSGSMAASVFFRREPGHYEDAPGDAGLALRWSSRF